MSDLDDLLADPETHGPVARATEAQLEALRAALAAGGVRRRDGGELPTSVEGAYLSNGGRWVYPDVHGLPSFVVEERLELDEPLEA